MIQVHPSAVVEKSVKLADGVKIGPNCVIESGVSVGENTEFIANVVVGKNVTIGANNCFFANTCIGGMPQILGMANDDQFGGLVIGDGNMIREQVTLHPSMHPGKFTTIGNDNLFMIGCHIGHDCTVADKIVMSNYVQIGGHCNIETGSWLSGMVGLHQFVTLGKWCYLAGLAGVTHDIPPFVIASGHYPTRVRSINKRGMSRAGLGSESQHKILQAYKLLYRNKKPLMTNAKALAANDDLDPNVRDILDSIMKSSQHRHGRYLETLRD